MQNCETCINDCRKCSKFPPDKAHHFNPRLLHASSVIKAYKNYSSSPFSNLKPPVSENDYLAARMYIKSMGYKVKGLRIEPC